MYSIIKDVIHSGEYDLPHILKKINMYFVQDELTEEERAELVNLAREYADFKMGVDVIKEIEELKKRVTALEEKEQTEPEEEYPEYVVGKWYYKDDKITHNGKKYVCIAPDGVVCTWNPDEYPAYWKLVE